MEVPLLIAVLFLVFGFLLAPIAQETPTMPPLMIVDTVIPSVYVRPGDTVHYVLNLYNPTDQDVTLSITVPVPPGLRVVEHSGTAAGENRYAMTFPPGYSSMHGVSFALHPAQCESAFVNLGYQVDAAPFPVQTIATPPQLQLEPGSCLLYLPTVQR